MADSKDRFAAFDSWLDSRPDNAQPTKFRAFDDFLAGKPAAPDPTQSSWTDYLKAPLAGALEGAGSIAQGGGDLVARGINAMAGTELRSINPLQGAIDRLRESMSESGKQAMRDSTPDGNLAEPETWTMGKDPSIKGLALNGLNAIGQFAPNLAIGLTTAGASLPAQFGVGAVAGYLQAYGSASEEERDRFNRMSHDELMQNSSMYRRLIEEAKVPPAQAKAMTADAAALGGGIGSGIPSALEQGFEDVVISALTKGKLKIKPLIGSGRAGQALTGAAGASPVGGLEEATEKATQNIGSNIAVGGNRQVGEGTFGDFVMGTIAEGVPGAAFGAAQKPAPDKRILDAGNIDDAVAAAQRALDEENARGSRLALPHYTGPTMVVMPDGTTMTGAEWEQERLRRMVQPADEPPAAEPKALPHYVGPTFVVMPDGSTMTGIEYEQQQRAKAEADEQQRLQRLQTPQPADFRYEGAIPFERGLAPPLPPEPPAPAGPAGNEIPYTNPFAIPTQADVGQGILDGARAPARPLDTAARDLQLPAPPATTPPIATPGEAQPTVLPSQSDPRAEYGEALRKQSAGELLSAREVALLKNPPSTQPIQVETGYRKRAVTEMTGPELEMASKLTRSPERKAELDAEIQRRTEAPNETQGSAQAEPVGGAAVATQAEGAQVPDRPTNPQGAAQEVAQGEIVQPKTISSTATEMPATPAQEVASETTNVASKATPVQQPVAEPEYRDLTWRARDPLVLSGKATVGQPRVWKSERAANMFLKASPKVRGYTPRKTADGWVLSKPPITPAQKAAGERLQRDKATIKPTDSLATLLRKVGGIRASEITADGGDIADMRDALRGAYRNGDGGITLEQAAEIMAEQGYDVMDGDMVDATKARELIQRVLDGEEVYSPQGQEERAAADAQARQKAEERAIPGGQERRTDADLRRRMEDRDTSNMTREELVAEVERVRRERDTDTLTGLGTKFTWKRLRQTNPMPHVVAFDLDSLKWVNDEMGHEAGDKYLAMLGQAFREAGLDAHRTGGDEVMAQGMSQAEMQPLIDKVLALLEGAEVVAIKGDERITKNGVGLSYGHGTDEASADAALARDKLQREEDGKRAARGEEPPGVVRGPAVETGQGGVQPASEEVAKTPPEGGVAASGGARDIPFSRSGKGAQSESLELTGETEGQIRAREAAEKKAATDKAKRDRAPGPEGFTLTGSDRPVDEAEARGQSSLFARRKNIRMSRSESRPGTFSERQFRAIVDAAMAKWANKPEVVIVDDMQDERVPAAAREEDAAQRSQGAEGSPSAFFYQGKVYILRSENPTVRDAVTNLFHEALGHYGLRGVFGDNLDGVLRSVISARRKEVEAKAAEYGLDMADPDQALKAAEEVLAALAQTRPEIGFVRRAVAAIRGYLRRVMPSLKLSDDEIITNFIMPARAFVEQGQGHGNASEEPRFSRAPAPDTEAFRRWFRDSKVVDADGKPMVVYHGSPDTRFVKAGGDGVFRTHRERNGMSEPRRAFFFAADERAAKTYADPHRAWDYQNAEEGVIPAYLSLQNPLVINAEGKHWRGTDAMIEKAMSAGHDGAIIRNVRDDYASQPKERSAPTTTVYVAFRPEQIKSAVGNVGTFDPKNPDIRFSRRKTPKWAEGNAALESATSKIDTYAPEKTMVEKVREMLQGWKERAVQKVFDAYAPLKRLGYKEYILARMAKATDGALEGTLLYGKPVLGDDGVIRGNLDKKGFLGAMKELKGEHDRFLMWVAGNRSARLKAEGKERLFSDPEITAMQRLDDGKMADGSSRKQAYAKALESLNGYNRAILDIAEKTGLIDAESRKNWEHDFYVPFFRVDEDMSLDAPATKVKGLVRQEAFKRLKGGKEPLGDLMANVMRNWSHLLSASMANQAAAASLKKAADIGAAIEAPEYAAKDIASSLGKKKGIVYFLDQGVKRHFYVDDPAILDAISAMESASFKGLPMEIMGKAKKWLTMGTTVSPSFRIRNLIRDSLSAIGQNEMSYNVMSNLAKGFSGTNKEGETYQQMLFNGALMRFGQLTDGKHAEHVKRLIDAGVDDATILTNPGKVKAAIEKLWDGYQEFGDRMENVNRAALYQKLRDDGLSEIEAAFASRDMMDFSLQGSSTAVRFLTQVVPFMNARLQGLYKLGRAAKENPARMGYVLGMVALSSIALMLAYQDDDDWKKREDWDRDNFWWFKAGGVAFRIPKPFEIGAMGTLAERSLELLISDEMTGKRYGQRLMAMLGDTFSLNPIPQLAKPALDLYANKDSFTGRQIETRGMENLSKPERYGPNTTAAAKFLGKAGDVTGLSPAQIDHILQGYFGWLGSHTAMTADLMAQPFMDVEKPARKIDDYIVLGDFVKSMPSDRSRYMEQFYKQAKEIHEVMGDLKKAREAQDVEKVKDILQDKKAEVALSHLYTSVERRMSELNRQVTMVRASKATAEEKRERLDRLNAIRNELARVAETQALKTRESARP